jgi:thiol:disulfide interchange protein
MRASTLRHPRWVACIVVVALVAVGCSAGVAYTTAPTPASTAVASRVPAATLPPLYDKTADAKADIDAALALAKADGKRVLLDFGADWCPDCHVLAAYLNGTAGRTLVEPNFHVVSIDVGYWDHNLDIAGAYGNPIKIGIPAVVVLEPDGSFVGSSADGSLASASGMTEQQVLRYLARWVP